MNFNFVRFRTISLIYFVRILTKILRLETPPILAVAAIVLKESKILFVDLSYAKGYALVGGRVKEGESLEKALQREVFEESGLNIRSAKYFGSYISKFRGISVVCATYLVETNGRLRSSGEGELVWFKPREVLGKLAYKDNEAAVKDFLKRK